MLSKPSSFTTPNTTTKINHLLLTSLGFRCSEITYRFEGNEKKSNFSALALWQMLSDEQRPNKVVVLVTDAVHEKISEKAPLPLFRKECEKLGLSLEEVRIPQGYKLKDLNEILEQAAKAIPENAKLTLDITQGLRHLGFLFYALALYLSELKQVEIQRVCYGMMEFNPAQPPISKPIAPVTPASETEIWKPIIDLTPTLELPQWFYAIRVYRETGFAGQIAELLDKKIEHAKSKVSNAKDCDKEQLGKELGSSKRLQKALASLAKSRGSALSWEAGHAASHVKKLIDSYEPTELLGKDILLADELIKQLSDDVSKIAFDEKIKPSSEKNKSNLDEFELKRQGRLVESYLEHDQLFLALNLMREWVVSYTVYMTWKIKKHDQAPGEWLDGKVRHEAENRLGGLFNLSKKENDCGVKLDAEQKQWGCFWGQLSAQRNELMHAGMRSEVVKPKKIKSGVIAFWKKLQQLDVPIPKLGGNTVDKILVTPLGNSPGVLFSALVKIKPDECIVICSKQSHTHIKDACDKANFKGKIHSLLIDDPHTGFTEIKKTIKEASPWLYQANEVFVNFTGGTTLLGIIASRLAKHTQKTLHRPCHEFVMIDRRPYEEQRKEPYKQGEIFHLDENENR